MTASVNPYGYPLLYVGQNAEATSAYTGIIGMRIYNLINQKMIDFETSKDEAALGKEDAVAPSSIVESGSDTLVYTAKNGLLYTLAMNTSFDLNNATISVNPVKTAYGYTGSVRDFKQGTPAAWPATAIMRTMATITGILQCVDMNTMQAVWAIDLGESRCARRRWKTEEDGGVYLYTGTALGQDGAQRADSPAEDRRADRRHRLGMPERDQGQVCQQGSEGRFLRGRDGLSARRRG